MKLATKILSIYLFIYSLIDLFYSTNAENLGTPDPAKVIRGAYLCT